MKLNPPPAIAGQPDRERIAALAQGCDLDDADALSIGFFRDIYLDVYEFAPVGYLTLNRQARIAAINQTGSALLGAAREVLVGHSFEHFIPADGLNAWRQNFLYALQEDGKQRCELSLQRDDGTRFDAFLRCLRLLPGSDGPLLRVALEDVSAQKREEQARIEQALRLRDNLTREVHHRIKNNLQVVTGLLSREAGKRPEVGGLLQSAMAQVHTVAVVHGLCGQVYPERVMLCELLPAVVQSVSGLSGVKVEQTGVAPTCGRLVIAESDTVAVALILNELLNNAVAHAGAMAATRPPQVNLTIRGDSGCVTIFNPGKLPDGFDFETGNACGVGLGLVRALMTSPGILLGFRALHDGVEAQMTLQPPVLSVS
ncbi:PAS domain S-box protein [Azoarcus sp. L1K30]|uniref:histidine kinase dimerization/phosphoacceptor domain -containing protein n=1 Tax=Azoarcus sp. L1K30 TaxID=2820277 RepID=UPI001B81C9F8|nr:histidine kinase dimerization/phosphoacceptor domain -containing protein [Azoarcus sp. L1K30]MBR0565337.1 PAS domain S-box protein [Azoarcus sp. L1K30]